MKRALLTALVLGLATPASAKIYDCDASDGNFATRFEIAFLEDGSVMAADAVAQRLSNEPLEPFIINESDRVLSVGWTVRNALNSRVQYATLSYTISIDKRTNRVRVRVKPQGYSNFFTSRGRCEVSALPS